MEDLKKERVQATLFLKLIKKFFELDTIARQIIRNMSVQQLAHAWICFNSYAVGDPPTPEDMVDLGSRANAARAAYSLLLGIRIKALTEWKPIEVLY